MKSPLAIALSLWLAAVPSFVVGGPQALAADEAPTGPIPEAMQQPPTMHARFVKGVAAPAALPGRPGRWIRFSNHNHSAYWDGNVLLGHMQVAAYHAGLEAFALTDHNTMRGTRSTEFLNPPEGMIMVKGEEWNASTELGEPVLGHACLLGLDGDKPVPSGDTLDEMLAEATARHGTIIINHPFCWRLSWQQSEPDARAHAVEVWNGWWYLAKPLMNNDTALGWWESALKKGRRLTAVAGTDNHGQIYDDIARNVNMVFAETPDEAGILKGIREGHVSVSAGLHEGCVYLEGDRDGDGTFDSLMGDLLPRPADGAVTVRARVIGGAGQQVAFYTADGRVAVKPVKSQNDVIPLTVRLRDGHDYVRAELRPDVNLPWSMTSVSNPIYFESAPVATAP